MFLLYTYHIQCMYIIHTCNTSVYLNTMSCIVALHPNNTPGNEENTAVKLFSWLYFISFSHFLEFISLDYISKSIRLFYTKISRVLLDQGLLFFILLDFGNIGIHSYSDIKEYSHVLINHIYIYFPLLIQQSICISVFY